MKMSYIQFTIAETADSYMVNRDQITFVKFSPGKMEIHFNSPDKTIYMNGLSDSEVKEFKRVLGAYE